MRLTPHPNFSHDGAASASETDHDDAGAEAPLALAASDAVLHAIHTPLSLFGPITYSSVSVTHLDAKPPA